MKRTMQKLTALLVLAALLAMIGACGPDDFVSQTPDPPSSVMEKDSTAHEAPLRVFVEPNMFTQSLQAELKSKQRRTAGPGRRRWSLSFFPGFPRVAATSTVRTGRRLSPT